MIQPQADAHPVKMKAHRSLRKMNCAKGFQILSATKVKAKIANLSVARRESK